MAFLRPQLIFMASMLSILTTVGSTAASAVRCDAVFGASKNWAEAPLPADYAGELNTEILKKNGFRIENDGSLYLLKSANGQELKLGMVKTLPVDYLFEWASKEESEAWIKAGGIDYMDSILKAPGQSSGKGYYISVDPFDSSMYGTDVTTFHLKKNLVFLEYADDSNPVVSRLMHTDTKLVRSLSRAGVEALHHDGYVQTWFSIISNKPLEKATSLPSQVLYEYLQSISVSPEILIGKALAFEKLDILPKSTLKGLPQEYPLRRFYLHEPMSIKDLEDFIRPYPLALRIEVAPTLYLHSKKLLAATKSATDVVKVLQLHAFSNKLLDSIRTEPTDSNLQRLGDFAKLTEFPQIVSRFIGPKDSPLAVILHVEILNNWILAAKSATETAKRIKVASAAFLMIYKENPQWDPNKTSH